MRDFDYEVMQKKRIARGAAHMKRGSKSKKCSLPSDYLTPAQLKKRSGPMSTYKLDAPMAWGEFTKMPTDLKVQYITGLQVKYGATDAMLGEMFGVTNVSVFNNRKKLGIKGEVKRNTSVADREARAKRWEAFIRGYEEAPIEEETVLPEEYHAEELPEEVETAEVDPDIQNVEDLPLPDVNEIRRLIEAPTLVNDEPKAPELSLSDLTATFKGEFDPTKFLHWIAMLPMPSGNVKIRVEVTAE